MIVFSDIYFWSFLLAVLLVLAVNHRLWRALRVQNAALLIASYIFYAQWDPRFLGLIVVSTFTDFVAGQRIHRGAHKRRWLWASLGINLGILGVFKYYDFFVSEAVVLLNQVGVYADAHLLNAVLPVGISFYTFQTLTYTIDIYRGQLEPSEDPIQFAAFVAFFPQLVAGPIERASRLLPQFSTLRRASDEQLRSGMRLILFGLTLKVVVADNLAPLVDRAFAQPELFNGGELLLATLYFAFQIYGDFCGYSTIAIGVAKLMGFELMTNFKTPYLAHSVQDFWRRWHVSLSTFFRDYVFIPLGGSRGRLARTVGNLWITFLVSGLWHGANWTFVAWGALHGAYLSVHLLIRDRLPKLPKVFGMAVTFALVCLAWVLFRAENMAQAWSIFDLIACDFGFPRQLRSGVVFVMLAVALDGVWRRDTRLESTELLGGERPLGQTLRWCGYTALTWLVLIYWGENNGQEFIYFQF